MSHGGMSATEALNRVIRGHLVELHTALPGRIERYDPVLQQADVQILLLRRYDTEEGKKFVQMPLITNAPVAFPRMGGAFVSLPVKVGDECLLIFAERSLDRWLTTGGMVDPDDGRMHHISDAIVYPGLSSYANPIPNVDPDDLVIGLESGAAEIHVKPDGGVWVKAGKISLGDETAGKALAKGDEVQNRLSKIESELTGLISKLMVAQGNPVPLGITPFVADTSDVKSSTVFSNG